MVRCSGSQVSTVTCYTIWVLLWYCNGVIMSTMASQITSLTIVYSTVYSRRRSKKTPKLRVTGLCEGNSPVTGEFPAQRASNAENVSIWWRHHDRARLWPSQEVQMTWQRCWAISRHRADWSYRDFIEVSLVVNDFKDISQIRRQFSKWPIRPCEISR